MEPVKAVLLVLVSSLISEIGAFIVNSPAPATTKPPAHRYTWAHWGSWSTCQVDCLKLASHNYKQSRSRDCKDVKNTVVYTHCGSSSGYRQTRNCPVHCPTWSSWSTWSDCSATCGGGSTIRVRHCGTGQTNCPGQAYETNVCGILSCPVNGSWTAWTPWSSCSHTCGSATKSRRRSCSSPAPKHGGANCLGSASETQSCNLAICTIDGGWTDWTGWNACDVTCGNGSEARIRTCTNPVPRDGGKYCSGSTVDVRACSKSACPIDGGWSDFTSRPCSASCGNGVTVKYRTCTNPAPAFGGHDCAGSATEFAVCKMPVCIIDGGWTEWSNWTDCEVVCGDGHRWRTRACENPRPSHGGANCTGESLQSSGCNNGLCPPDIKSCHDSEIQSLVHSSLFVVDPDARPQICNTSDSLQAEILIQKHCQVLSSELDWELGIQILDNCDKVPLYVPVGLIDKQTKRRKYGILLDCYRQNIQIADLSCSERLEVRSFKLNHLETDYHIMLL